MPHVASQQNTEFCYALPRLPIWSQLVVTSKCCRCKKMPMICSHNRMFPSTALPADILCLYLPFPFTFLYIIIIILYKDTAASRRPRLTFIKLCSLYNMNLITHIIKAMSVWLVEQMIRFNSLLCSIYFINILLVTESNGPSLAILCTLDQSLILTKFFCSNSSDSSISGNHRRLGQIHHSGGPCIQALKFETEKIDRISVGANGWHLVQMSQAKNQTFVLDFR